MRRPAHEESFTRVRTDIMRYGWHDIGVFPTVDEPGVPFNYTIGLTERGLPELIIFGLPGTAAHQLLRCAIADIERDGEISDGALTDQVLRDYLCVYRELPRALASVEHMCWADAYYADRQDVRMFQVVWPDRNGRFPWEAGCETAACQCEIIDWRQRPPG